jgi:hypothetical protein
MVSRKLSRQKVNNDVNRWDQAIGRAQELLSRAEGRVARLRGAIKTFSELRDCGQAFSGPESLEQIVIATQPNDHKSESATLS